MCETAADDKRAIAPKFQFLHNCIFKIASHKPRVFTRGRDEFDPVLDLPWLI